MAINVDMYAPGSTSSHSTDGAALANEASYIKKPTYCLRLYPQLRSEFGDMA